MGLITDSTRTQLLAYNACSAHGEDVDPLPLVKLSTPDGSASWLLTELDPQEPDIAFDLCDLDVGSLELGTIRLSEVETARGALRLPVKRDLSFRADRSICRFGPKPSYWARFVSDRPTPKVMSIEVARGCILRSSANANSRTSASRHGCSGINGLLFARDNLECCIETGKSAA